MRDLVQFDVLISCPSDIENRGFINTIKDIVYNFNTNYGFKIGVSIRILYWKDSSYPEYGDTPQDIINRQIVDNADAVIAVFGNVFGTATSRYGSGTEEEIEKMISSGKQIFLYFQNKSTETNNLILEEVQKVRDFKKKYGKKGLYTEFKSKPQFKQLLLEHLISYFTNNPLVDARDKGWPHIVTNYEIQFCYTDSSEILVKKILTILSLINDYSCMIDRFGWKGKSVIKNIENAILLKSFQENLTYTACILQFDHPLSRGEEYTIEIEYSLDNSENIDPRYVSCAVNIPIELIVFKIETNLSQKIAKAVLQNFSATASRIPMENKVLNCDGPIDVTIQRPIQGNRYVLSWEFNI